MSFGGQRSWARPDTTALAYRHPVAFSSLKSWNGRRDDRSCVSTIFVYCFEMGKFIRSALIYKSDVAG